MLRADIQERLDDMSPGHLVRQAPAAAAPDRLLGSRTVLVHAAQRLHRRREPAAARLHDLDGRVNDVAHVQLLGQPDKAVEVRQGLGFLQAVIRQGAAGSARETAAILSILTSTCRCHDINPQAYLTQLLANPPDTPVSRVDEWLPDRWNM